MLAGVVVWGVVTTVRPPAPATAPVLVAQRDLVPGAVVRDDDVQALPRPVDAVAGDVLSDPGTAVGRTVSFPVRSGESVTARHLVGVELLDALGAGLVATPVTLADPGAAALVSRGDVVDVLAAASGAATGTPTAAVVASRVRVLIAPVPADGSGRRAARVRRVGRGCWRRHGAGARHHHRAGAGHRACRRGVAPLAHPPGRLTCADGRHESAYGRSR